MMKVKISIIFLILGLITLSLVSCGNVTVEDDLSNYINEWNSKVNGRDVASSAAFYSAINENYIDDDTLYSDIKDDIMPDLKEVIGIAEEIAPKTDEVKAVHEKYLNALNMQFSAYELVLTTIESQDSEDITQANDKLAEAGEGAQEFASSLSELAEKYGVEFGDNKSSESDDAEVSFVPVDGKFQMTVEEFVSIMDLELSNNNYKKLSEWKKLDENGSVTYLLDSSFMISFSTADDGKITSFTYFMGQGNIDPETARIMGYLRVRTVGKVDLEQRDGIINSLGNFSSTDNTIANASGTNADYSYIVKDGLAMFTIRAKK